MKLAAILAVASVSRCLAHNFTELSNAMSAAPRSAQPFIIEWPSLACAQTHVDLSFARSMADLVGAGLKLQPLISNTTSCLALGYNGTEYSTTTCSKSMGDKSCRLLAPFLQVFGMRIWERLDRPTFSRFKSLTSPAAITQQSSALLAHVADVPALTVNWPNPPRFQSVIPCIQTHAICCPGSSDLCTLTCTVDLLASIYVIAFGLFALPEPPRLSISGCKKLGYEKSVWKYCSEAGDPDSQGFCEGFLGVPSIFDIGMWFRANASHSILV